MKIHPQEHCCVLSPIRYPHTDHISVRLIRDDLLFNEELLEDVGFQDQDSWILHDGAHVVADGVIVNQTSGVSQQVSMSGGRLYKLTVTARCLDNRWGQGWIHINWQDARARFIKGDVRIFDCATGSRSYSKRLAAPATATSAVVHAIGYTGDIIINTISLKKRP